MAKLQENDGFVEDIYQLETDDPVLGGPNGVDNLQAKQLGGRTLWLRSQQLPMYKVSAANILPDDNYAVQESDIGKIVTIKYPGHIVSLPSIANFPKYRPLTIAYSGNGVFTSQILYTTDGNTIRDVPGDETQTANTYLLRPGARVVIVATDNEWLIVSSSQNSIAPVASYLEKASKSDINGYLYCDGRAVSRSTYGDLFAEIGTIYGAGNGTTTFNIPDRRGVFSRGLDDGRLLDFGRTLGSLQGDMFKAHAHKQGSESLYDLYYDPFAEPETPNGDLINNNRSWTNVPQQSQVYSRQLTQKVGGTETRPKNISVCVYIKY